MIFPSVRTLYSVFLLGLISVGPTNVIANPTGAGTCDVSDMAAQYHGPSTQSKGSTPYTITTSPTSPGNYKITLNGSGSIKGLLIYAVNSANQNTRIGQFTSYPKGIVPKACSGSTGSTLNHNSPDPKPLPMTFQWNSGGVMQGQAAMKAIVVLDQTPGSWTNVQDFTLNLANGTSVAGTSNNTTTNNSNNQDLSGTTESNQSENQFFLVAFINNYPLFNVVALITIVVYIVGAVVEYLLKRQQIKARSYAKSVNGYDTQ